LIIATIYFVGFGWAFLTLPITKTFAHSLLAGAGASTLIIGFASKQVLSNMISGVFIIMNKPFKINDLIEIQGNHGKVIEIALHDTIIENEEDDRIY
jgi:small conductance mechanosensitive channel